MYEIILKFVGEDNELPFVLMKVATAREAQRMMKGFSGKMWTLNRRPDLHTFPLDGSRLLALTFRRTNDRA